MKKKPIDAHGEALDLLREERDQLEDALSYIKPRINNLMRYFQAGDMESYKLASSFWGGDISKLTKHRNDLQRRFNNVEETRRLLKRDRAHQQETAWEDEQHRLEMEKIAAKTFLQCGCW